LRQSGCIRVSTIEEMFETAKSLLRFREIKGNKIAILTNAGGPAILCTDEAEKNNLVLPQLEAKTINRLKEILHPEASLKNPVDMLPSADAQTYRLATKILSEDENIDAIIAIFVEPVMIDSFEVIYQLAEEQKANSKPILIVTFPLPHFWERWKKEGAKDAIILKSVELAPVILKNLFDYHRRKLDKQIENSALNKNTTLKISKVITKAKSSSPKIDFLSSEECSKILKALGLPLIKNYFFKEKSEILRLSNKIKFPCVLKISSRKLTHKSDINGVILNIQNKKELITNFEQLKTNLKKKNLLHLVDCFEVQEFFSGEIEIIVGGYRDKSFGPVIMFGAGGKFVELIGDKNLALAPMNENQAKRLIESSKVFPLLSGYRNLKKTNLSKLTEVILKVSELLSSFEEIIEIDLNPIIINGQQIKIVDSRIRIR
jgi:acetyltransferase